MDDRKWEANADAAPPAAPSSPSSGYPRNGSPPSTPATQPGAYWFYQIGAELRALVVAAGLTPALATLTQVRDAVLALVNGLARVDVASSATVDLDAAGSSYVNIQGTTTVTAFTRTNGRKSHIVAQDALPITTGASLLIPGVPSGVTLTLVAGDTFDVYGEAAGVVRLSGLVLPGTQVGYARTNSTTVDSTSSVIPFDDTPPQNTEGKEYLTCAFTPRYATSLIEVEAFIPLIDGGGSVNAILALFDGVSADAIAASRVDMTGDADQPSFGIVRAVVAAGSTSARTYALRYGSSEGNAIHIGEDNSGNDRFGTARVSSLTVKEIRQ